MSSKSDGFMGIQMVPPEEPEPEPSTTEQPGSTAGEQGGEDRSGVMDALFGGSPAAAGDSGGGGIDLGGLLGSLLGGANQGIGQGGGAGGLDLGALMGGADEGAGQAGGLDLGSLLGSLLASGGPATGMPGSNAGSSQGSSGLAGLLGALLSGGSAGNDSALGQTGLAPAIIQAALPLVLGALMKGQAGRSGQINLGAAGDTSGDLADRLQSGEPLDEGYVRSTGLPEQLAAQTGMDVDSATTAMQRLLAAMQSETH